MATREQLIEDFADHKYATGEKFARLINSMKVVQLPVVDPVALGTSLSFIDSISQDADGKITATKKTLDLANARELNPFKGWWKTGDTLPTSGFDGAYLYFKDTTQTPAVTTIYRWNGTAYADTGTVVDESNVQTFGSGQQVNAVYIKNENGKEVQGPADVLSAEAVAKLLSKIGDMGVSLEYTTNADKSILGHNTQYAQLGDEFILLKHHSTSFIDVSGYKQVSFLGLAYTPSIVIDTGYCFYDASKTALSGSTWRKGSDVTSSEESKMETYTVDVPEGAKFFRCDLRDLDTLQSFFIKGYTDEDLATVIKRLDASVEEVEGDLTKVDAMANLELVELSYTTNADKSILGHNNQYAQLGDEFTLSGHHSTSFIDVSGYKQVSFLGLAYTPSIVIDTGYCFYDASKTALSGSTWRKGSDVTSSEESKMETYTVDVPEGAKFFRCDLRDLDTLQSFFIKGKLPIVYEVEGDLAKVDAMTNLELIGLSYTANAGKSIAGHNNQYAQLGDEFDLSGHHSTSFIDVSGYKQVSFLGLAYMQGISNLDTGYCFYDASKTALSGSTWRTGADVTSSEFSKMETYTVDVPEGAKFFRCDLRDLDTLQSFFIKGKLPIVYEVEKSMNAEVSTSSIQLSRITQNLRDVKFAHGKSPSFTLVHFSDIHGDAISLQYIVDFRNRHSEHIDDVLHTGDSVWFKWSHGMGFWDNVEGSEFILNTIGNHDTSNNGGWTYGDRDAAECYDRYISPYLSNWGGVVISPNTCYYYKDYTQYGVRLIVLDLYHWDNTQQDWLETSLNGAISDSLHVIVAGHSTERTWGTHIDTPFDTLEFANGLVLDSRLPCLPSSAITAISTFISGGGKFVCYLSGHTHFDSMRKFNGHDNMVWIAIQNASVLEHINGATSATGPNNLTARIVGEKSEFCFNVIAVDTVNSILTVMRVGQDSDRYGRHLGSVVYDYDNNRIVSQW